MGGPCDSQSGESEGRSNTQVGLFPLESSQKIIRACFFFFSLTALVFLAGGCSHEYQRVPHGFCKCGTQKSGREQAVFYKAVGLCLTNGKALPQEKPVKAGGLNRMLAALLRVGESRAAKNRFRVFPPKNPKWSLTDAQVNPKERKASKEE